MRRRCPNQRRPEPQFSQSEFSSTTAVGLLAMKLHVLLGWVPKLITQYLLIC